MQNSLSVFICVYLCLSVFICVHLWFVSICGLAGMSWQAGSWRILSSRWSACLSRVYQASDLSASCCLGFVEDGGDVAAQGGFGAAEAEADAFVAQASRQ